MTYRYVVYMIDGGVTGMLMNNEHPEKAIGGPFDTPGEAFTFKKQYELNDHNEVGQAIIIGVIQGE